MKKISTLFMGLIIALSAVAAPVKVLNREAASQLQKIDLPAYQVGQFVKKSITPRRAVADAVIGSGIDSVAAVLYDGVWYLDAYAGGNWVVEFGFYNGKTDQIAGTYEADGKNAIAFVIAAAGDSVYAEGTFHIDYMEEGLEFPKYHIYATGLTDSLSRTFDFDFTAEVYAWDYMNYMYCAYFGSYCDEVDIQLADAPVVPTGDTIRIAIDGLKFSDNMATSGWWEMAGYSADSLYLVDMSNATDTTRAEAVGTYTFEEMDPSYTYLYVGEEKILFNEGTVTLSQNEDGTYHIDAELLARTGDVYVLTLDSKLKQVSENVITLTYDADTRSVNIATTNDDPYFFYIETQSEYDEYESDFTQESLIEEIDAWIYTMQQYQALSYFTFTGNMTVDCVDFFGSYAATDDYVALAAPIEDAEVNGTAVYLQFHFEYVEAVENTNAVVKAAKVLRNGQLFILKNGVEYNAQGAIVK